MLLCWSVVGLRLLYQHINNKDYYYYYYYVISIVRSSSYLITHFCHLNLSVITCKFPNVATPLRFLSDVLIILHSEV